METAESEVVPVSPVADPGGVRCALWTDGGRSGPGKGLESQGFTVKNVAPSRTLITFSGTVAPAESAFRTQIHQYRIGIDTQISNATGAAHIHGGWPTSWQGWRVERLPSEVAGGRKTSRSWFAETCEHGDPLPRKAPTVLKISKRFLESVDGARLAEKSKLYYHDGWRLLSATPVTGLRLDLVTNEVAGTLRFGGSSATPTAHCAPSEGCCIGPRSGS